LHSNREGCVLLEFLEFGENYATHPFRETFFSRATLDAHSRLDGVEARIDRFEAHVDQRFDTLEGRFDTLEGRFGTLHTEVGVVVDSVRKIEARIEDLIGRFTDPERPTQP